MIVALFALNCAIVVVAVFMMVVYWREVKRLRLVSSAIEPVTTAKGGEGNIWR